jgi:hypothetical protein
LAKFSYIFISVAYQPRGQVASNTPDPLADPAACARDAPLMAKLGTNVLRVYEVNKKIPIDAVLIFFLGGP